VQALVNSPPSLTALSLKDCSDLTDEDLNSLLEKLPDLEVFSLDLALHHANISDAVLDSLGKKCPKLKKVHFGHINCDFTQKGILELIKKMPNIESLTIPCYEENYDELLITIAEHCPHLRELTVYGNGHVGRDVLKRFGEKCSKLQSLDTNITIRDEAVNYVPRTYFPKLVNYSQFAAHALFPEYRTSHYGFFNERSGYF
jgi:hypothetical protein